MYRVLVDGKFGSEHTQECDAAKQIEIFMAAGISRESMEIVKI